LFRVIFAVRFSLSAVCRYTSLLLLPVALHSPSILVLLPFLPTRTSILPHSLAHTTHLASSFPQETSNCHRNNNTPCPITACIGLVYQISYPKVSSAALLLHNCCCCGCCSVGGVLVLLGTNKPTPTHILLHKRPWVFVPASSH
jgi:hypothetical protein